MTNPLKGEARLSLDDGREFTLVLDFDGLIEAEQAYGKPLAQMMAEARAGFMGALRAMLFGALQRNHRGTSMADAGQILLTAQAQALQAITAAVEAAMPDAKAEGDNAGNARRRPAGKSSGRSGAKRG